MLIRRLQLDVHPATISPSSPPILSRQEIEHERQASDSKIAVLHKQIENMVQQLVDAEESLRDAYNGKIAGQLLDGVGRERLPVVLSSERRTPHNR